MQSEVNIGLVGHVDHGKTTLTQALSGVWTDRHSEELKRGITIRLGYADTTFRKCVKCPEPECYTTSTTCSVCNSKTEALRTVSFVDAPGHETLMATMLAGAAIMDGAILLIAANEKCPQPQTKEHLMALDIIGVKNIIIVQNKVELVSEDDVKKNYQEIKKFVKGTVAENAPIIPLSAQHKVNIDYLIQAIQEIIPTPKRDSENPFRMYVARSFDINRPGTKIEDLCGAVIGGTVTTGKLKVNSEIEIKPGIKDEKFNTYTPIVTNAVSLTESGKKTDEITPGGLVGIATYLDPYLGKSDSLSGQLIGEKSTLPEVWSELKLKTHLLRSIVGTQEEMKNSPILMNEPLMLNVVTSKTIGVVSSVQKDAIVVTLKIPICAEKNARVAISRRIDGRWRLIGHGIII